MKEYVARYVVVPSKLIFNQCGPENSGPDGWTDHLIRKKKKAAQKYISKMNEKNNFYNKLEANILKEGIRNPILVSAGWCPESIVHCLPPKMQKDPAKILICHSNGGSRLWICQKHNLNIPCIVSDFIEMFPNEKVIYTKEDLLEYYKDKPRGTQLGKKGVLITLLPQIHLGEIND